MTLGGHDLQMPDISLLEPAADFAAHPAALGDEQARRAQTDSLDRVHGLQHDEVGVATDVQTVTVEAHDLRGIAGHGVEAEAHRLAAGQLPDMQSHMGDIEHVGGAQ